MIFASFNDIPPLRYGLIMADPPWSFKNYSKKGERKGAAAQYDCMTLGEIKALPVSHLASDDCILWLWATNPMLDQCFEALKAWGFKFCTAGSWEKVTEKGKQRWGGGYRLRSTNEPYLIGTIGKPLQGSRSIPSSFRALAREHSRKPDLAYKHAEMMAPNAWRLDLFSRQERPGWDCFGNEVGKFEGVE
jgi:N6-adenosine-specific RNA methylase IME4